MIEHQQHGLQKMDFISTTLVQTKTDTPTNCKRGFSLVELLIATTIFTVAMAAVMSTFMLISKTTYALYDLNSMNSENRFMVEQFARDIRSTTNIDYDDNDRNKLVLTIEDPNGVLEEVAYRYHPDKRTLTRGNLAGTFQRTLIKGIDSLEWVFYDSRDKQTINKIDIKKVQLQMNLSYTKFSRTVESTYTSARLLMRNRVPVSEI